VGRSEVSKVAFNVVQRAHKLKCLKKARFLRSSTSTRGECADVGDRQSSSSRYLRLDVGKFYHEGYTGGNADYKSYVLVR
jgi:hypothetical protein